MKKTLLTTSVAAGFATLMASSASLTAAVLYNNTSTDLSKNFSLGNSGNTSIEAGDQVVLNTTHVTPTIQNFQFGAWAQGYTGNPTVQGQVRFYANNGAGGAPGSVLYNSGLFPIALQTIGGGAIGNASDITYYQINFTTADFGNNLVVPKNMTWSVQFSDLQGGELGVRLFSPPTVGQNWTDYWENSGSWTRMVGAGPLAGVNMDFNGYFDGLTVPEPAPMLAMGVLGAIGSFVAWRRSRKSA